MKAISVNFNVGFNNMEEYDSLNEKRDELKGTIIHG